MKLIFIPVSDRPECAIALHHGFNLGQQIQADVAGCHIRPHSDSTVSLPDEAPASVMSLDSYDLAWEAALKEKNTDLDSVNAKTLFSKLAAQFDYQISKKPQDVPSANWSEKVGSPQRLFAIMGPVSDLIILSRPAKQGRSLAKNFMLNAVLNAATPVLVLPQSNMGSLGKNICIAWNQSNEAAKAVKAALPLLQQADKVTIVTCGAEDKPGPKAKHLQAYLKHWKVTADHVKSQGSNDSEAIIKGYEQTDSDLLVMGGYSRSRLRQQVFGGVTEYMLNNASIPVFVLHN